MIPLRTYDEMMDLIMNRAIKDERIRAVTMEGSRANENSVCDEYSDFDICYYVTDIKEFTSDKNWIECFGKTVIVQCPCDDYDDPYDYNGNERFTYLMQFEDGNRIDLTLIDISKISEELENDEPRIILLNKDNYTEIQPVYNDEAFYLDEPTEKEFQHAVNEFRWVSIYVTKGLCRNQIYYAKHCYDVVVMGMFIKMLEWKIGVNEGFDIVTGKYSKYLKEYLSEEEMNRFKSIFPNGEYDDIWNKLFIMYDYFEENAEYVATKLNFAFDKNESEAVRNFLKTREEDYYCNR